MDGYSERFLPRPTVAPVIRRFSGEGDWRVWNHEVTQTQDWAYSSYNVKWSYLWRTLQIPWVLDKWQWSCSILLCPAVPKGGIWGWPTVYLRTHLALSLWIVTYFCPSGCRIGTTPMDNSAEMSWSGAVAWYQAPIILITLLDYAVESRPQVCGHWL
jgi:hypothetical protein